MTDFSRQTVLHLCSAHIIKEVQGAIGRRITDKGLKEFATHCEAQLINTTSLKRAVDIFKCMGHVFYTKANTQCVNGCLQQLHDHIRGIKITEDTLHEKQAVDDYIPPEAKTILARSPFTKEFASVLDPVMSIEDPEEKTEMGNNKYYCPGILDILMKDYMPIFPLWSGIMLGDLKRYNDRESIRNGDDLQKTHDTNCHAENMFCIVKDKILQKETAPSASNSHTKNGCIITRLVQGAYFATRPSRQNVTEVFQCEKRKIAGLNQGQEEHV